MKTAIKLTILTAAAFTAGEFASYYRVKHFMSTAGRSTLEQAVNETYERAFDAGWTSALDNSSAVRQACAKHFDIDPQQ